MIDTYRAYNLAHHDARVRPYPGAVACVRALAEAGVKIAIVTSKNRHSTERGLEVAGLSGSFSVLVCADDVTNPKPHKEPVELALARLLSRPAEAIFVGDSLHDMHAGRSAGVATGAALWGPLSRADLAPSEPSYWLEKPEDLLPLVLG
jgi:pyrophosphatase PpaX